MASAVCINFLQKDIFRTLSLSLSREYGFAFHMRLHSIRSEWKFIHKSALHQPARWLPMFRRAHSPFYSISMKCRRINQSHASSHSQRLHNRSTCFNIFFNINISIDTKIHFLKWGTRIAHGWQSVGQQNRCGFARRSMTNRLVFRCHQILNVTVGFHYVAKDDDCGDDGWWWWWWRRWCLGRWSNTPKKWYFQIDRPDRILRWLRSSLSPTVTDFPCLFGPDNFEKESCLISMWISPFDDGGWEGAINTLPMVRHSKLESWSHDAEQLTHITVKMKVHCAIINRQ